MHGSLYDTRAAKEAVDLSINSDLLQKARALDVDLSKALEERLEQIVREQRARQWQEENRDGIEGFNEHVAKHGLWNDVRRRR